MEEEVPVSSRREFIAKTLLATAGMAFPIITTEAGKSTNIITHRVSSGADEPMKVCIFSKQMHWLGYEAMAQTAAQIGFDGIDLTVRPDGHVKPEHVETELPKAIAAIHKAGLSVPMITTKITDAKDPLTEPILKTASQLGVKYYRLGYLPYPDGVPMETTLQKYKQQLKALADLNRKYNIQGAYQNHSGTDVGAPVWDLWYLIKEMDPRWMGSQYDIKHATLEGGFSWPLGFKAIQSHIKTLDIKDFFWIKKNGKWDIQYTPLGEGMVDFKKFFALVKQYNISGPISLHLEYPLGGADTGARKLTVPESTVIEAMRKDLTTLRGWLKEAQLSG
ncbi:sugar phosphate isomerase/epimerase family protein [Adhaeribacter aquaticus]|uniref:sugar phosphate isomerase/epimerase family protein n=1 Tax=Adhaeribacter aquaticus TaxID=299567 RepID=UPI000408EA5A|nr:sugar phosphate isomerase/epimerase family protein [Adhaeribacter aquaticus]